MALSQASLKLYAIRNILFKMKLIQTFYSLTFICIVVFIVRHFAFDVRYLICVLFLCIQNFDSPLNIVYLIFSSCYWNTIFSFLYLNRHFIKTPFKCVQEIFHILLSFSHCNHVTNIQYFHAIIQIISINYSNFIINIPKQTKSHSFKNLT